MIVINNTKAIEITKDKIRADRDPRCLTLES